MTDNQLLTHQQRAERIISNLILLGGNLCLDFCNTAEYRETDHPVELMVSYRALVNWSVHVNTLIPAEADQLLEHDENADSVLQEALRLRQAVYTVFVAHIREQTVPAEELGYLNAQVQKALATRSLVAGGGGFEWRWGEYDLAKHMLLPVALAASELLTAPYLNRVRQCPGCGWLFLDQSKNRNRTWCNMQLCGNRAKAKRHYERQKNTP